MADGGEEHAMLVGNILVDVVRTGHCTIQLSHSRHSSQYDADQTAVLENIPQDPTIHASYLINYSHINTGTTVKDDINNYCQL